MTDKKQDRKDKFTWKKEDIVIISQPKDEKKEPKK